MKMKNCVKTLAVAFISLAGVMSSDAKVHAETYSVTPLRADFGDVEKTFDMLVTPSVALYLGGGCVPGTQYYQVGIYSNLVAEAIPSFESGVILSNGHLVQGSGSSLTNTSSQCELPGEGIDPDHPSQDADLIAHFESQGSEFYDHAGIIFYLRPKNKTINIPFVMASEEFYLGAESPEFPEPEVYEAGFSDKFVFFLEELGENAVVEGNKVLQDDVACMTNNIAQLPEGGDVEIASVNQHTNTAYFISNIATNEDGFFDFETGDINLPMEFNGAIVGPVAVAENLDTNKVYKIKIMLADCDDDTYTSVVFLREKGITSGADLRIGVAGPAFFDNPPGVATFTNTVSNVGPATANGVVVTNYLPVGANSIAYERSVGEVVGPVPIGGTNCLIWTIGDQFRHGSNAVMMVKCNLPETGFYTNSAVVVTSTGDYDVKNNADEWVAQVGGDIQNITVSAISTNMAYGSPLEIPNLQFIKSIEGTNGTDAVTGIDVKFYDGEELVQPSTATVGTYRIVLSNIKGGGILPSAHITWNEGLLTVTQRVLTVIANSTNRVYGSTLSFVGSEFTTVPAELPNGETVTRVKITSKDGVAGNAKATAGEYPGNIISSHVVLGGNGFKTNNYDIVFSNGTLTVDKREIEITPKNITKEYGMPHTLTRRASNVKVTKGSLVAGDKIASVTLASAGTPKTAPAGRYPITVSDAEINPGLGNYEVSYGTGTLLVVKADLTIIANSTNRVYGTRIDFTGKEFTTEPAELPNGDTVTNVTITSEMATNLTADVGVYTNEIVPSHAVWGRIDTNNYDIVFSNGTLTVTKAPLTIFANDISRVYGTTTGFTGKEFTTKPVAADMPNNEKVDTVTITSVGGYAGDAMVPAGDYPENIVPSYEVTGSSGFKTNNYEIAFSNGTLTVTKAAMGIEAFGAEKFYDAEPTNITWIVTNALGQAIAADVISLRVRGTVDWIPVDEFAPFVDATNGVTVEVRAAKANHIDATNAATVIIHTRPVTLVAATDSKTYDGTPLTNWNFSVKTDTETPGYGFVKAEGVQRVTMTAASVITNAGTQANVIETVVASNGTDLARNYVVTKENGTLTVTKAALKIIAKPASKKYGDMITFAGTEFTTVPGTLPTGVTVTSVTLTSDKAKDEKTAAGTYLNEIKPSAAVGDGHGNCTITYENGTLTVTKVPLAIIADDKSRVYGSTLSFTGKEFTTLPTALPNGDRVGTVTLTSAKGADVSTVVGTYPKSIVPSHVVTGINTNNYDITFSNGTLKVTQAALTVKVNDAKWNIKKPKPTYSFADFTSQLKGGDTVASVVGGAGLSQSDYTNKVWATKVPVKGDEGKYPDEIWIKLTSINGPRAANYLITIDPGDLTVDTALPELKTIVEAKLNRKDGLLYLKLTIENTGDGDVEPDSDYWVELKPGDGPVTDDKGNTYAHSYEIRSKTNTMPDGYDYQELTASVKAALRKIHRNADEAFHPNDVVKIGISDAGFVPDAEVSISVFHYLRWAPEHFIVDGSKFFIAGQLFNVADTDRNFKVSAEEKTNAAALLGENSADYLEVTRLQLLPYYHWSTADQTWK